MDASRDKTGRRTPEAIGQVSLNGRLVPANEATVPVFDRGFLYGDALIETMKLLDGRPVFFPEHIARLSRGLAAAGIRPVPAEEELWRRCVELAGVNGLTAGRLRLQVTRGTDPPGQGPDPGSGYAPTLLITAQGFAGYPERFYREGMVCATVQDNRGARASLKSSSLMATVLARGQARAAGADEALFTGHGGVLLEGAYTNIFFRGGDRLFTTPVDENILPGVTRAAVMAILASIGAPVGEMAVRLEDLADEKAGAFLSGSLLGFCPVSRIDSRALEPDRKLAGRVNDLLRERERESVSRTYG